MKIDTWIKNELVTIDVDEQWITLFAAYDALVPTETAIAIATAVTDILKTAATEPIEVAP
jgi:hypothetical protein